MKKLFLACLVVILALAPAAAGRPPWEGDLRKVVEEGIEEEIVSLRSRLKKETQFIRRMELNIEIKKLEQSKNRLLGGNANG